MTKEQRAARAAESVGGTESADRVADVLLLFAQSDRPWGSPRSPARSSLSKAVVHRILQSLTSRSLLQPVPGTPRTSWARPRRRLSAKAWSQLDVRSLAAPILRRLRDETRETTTLSVLVGHQRIYLDQFESPQEVKMVVELGPAVPAALRRLQPRRSWPSSRRTSSTRRSAQLRRAPTRPRRGRLPSRTSSAVREHGYARSLNERGTGAASIAAPFFDAGRQRDGLDQLLAARSSATARRATRTTCGWSSPPPVRSPPPSAVTSESAAAPLPRSFLYVPAVRRTSSPRRTPAPADAVVLDLEDAVPLPDKAEARDARSADWLGAREPPATRRAAQQWVRVDPDSLADDLEAAVPPRSTGILLAKCTPPRSAQSTRTLAGLERTRGSAGSIPVVGLVESARGAPRPAARWPRRRGSPTFGIGETDLLGDLRLARTGAPTAAVDAAAAAGRRRLRGRRAQPPPWRRPPRPSATWRASPSPPGTCATSASAPAPRSTPASCR